MSLAEAGQVQRANRVIERPVGCCPPVSTCEAQHVPLFHATPAGAMMVQAEQAPPYAKEETPTCPLLHRSSNTPS